MGEAAEYHTDTYAEGLEENPPVKKSKKKKKKSPEKAAEEIGQITAPELVVSAGHNLQVLPPEQKARSKRKEDREPRRFDQTYLTEDFHGEIVHRDYASHFFRWGFATRHVINRDVTSVLDVGCGPEIPLYKALIGGINANYPGRYVGVDMNRIKTKNRRAMVGLYEEFDLTSRYEELMKDEGYPFELITCFEVIEHMSVADGIRLLQAMRALINMAPNRALGQPSGVLMLSTPVFDGFRARNHIHEYTIPELQSTLEGNGWAVERRFGTFASVNVLKKQLTPEHLSTFTALQAYYGNEVMSTFLAPLYPDHSRNNIWICRPD
jgi:2-polyprenyl-3-methyl-5-hydroxy-6-metoxy-1,4-benzoquinol methylase